MSKEFTEEELHSTIINLLAEIRIDQKITLAYLDALTRTTLSEEQRPKFRELFKTKYSEHLQELSKENSYIFDEDILSKLLKPVENTDNKKPSEEA